MKEKKISNKRLAILEAAEKIIAKDGIQGFSMHKLAQEAQVAAGTIYRCFNDKEDLLYQLRLMVAQRIATTIYEGVESEKNFKAKFFIMWLNIWNLGCSHHQTICNRLQYESLPKSDYEKTREKELTFFSEIEKLFEEGKKTHIFKNLSNEILSVLFFDPALSLSKRHAWNCYQLSEKERNAAIEASWDAIIQH